MSMLKRSDPRWSLKKVHHAEEECGRSLTMSLAIIVGNVHGFRTREWKGASRESIRWIIAGIAVLVVGVCLLAQGKAMMPD